MALEGIEFRFNGDPERSDTGSPGEILESVQTKIKKGSAQKQSGALPQGRTGRKDLNLIAQVQSGPDNTGSLLHLLEIEEIDLSEKKAALKDCVVTSDLYTSVDAFLEYAGFTPHDLGVTLGQGAYNDEFEIRFINDNTTEVLVSGEIRGDDLLFVNVESPGMVPPVYDISLNETYVSLDSTFRNEGYEVSKFSINVTTDEAAIRVIYERGNLNKGIHITVRDREMVSVVLEDPESGIHFVLPFVVLVITTISAFLCYRGCLRWSCKNRSDEGVEGIIGAERKADSPLELLEKSYEHYEMGELKKRSAQRGRH